MTDTPDRWHQKVSVPDMLKMLVLVFGVGGAWAIIGVTGDNNTQAIAELRVSVSEDLGDLERDLKGIEVRTRGLEQDRARADERFSSILGLLARIDGRLERIEGKD